MITGTSLIASLLWSFKSLGMPQGNQLPARSASRVAAFT